MNNEKNSLFKRKLEDYLYESESGVFLNLLFDAL